MSIPLSGHNTLVSVQFTPGGAFTEIAELGDITLPGLSRNEFDVTTQNRNIDKYLLGVLRRDSVMWPMNFIPDDPTHGVLGLMKLMKDNTFTGFKITIPTSAGSSVWIGSGQVRTMNNLKAPVDGKMTADVNVRLSDIMSIDGVIFGL